MDCSAKRSSRNEPHCRNDEVWKDSFPDGGEPLHPEHEKFIPIVHNKIFFMISSTAPVSTPDWVAFTTDDTMVFNPFCDDFGPFNLASVHHFCSQLHNLLETYPSRSVVYYTTGSDRDATNSAFLVASFLVMEMELSPEDAWRPFAEIQPSPFVGFRDASYNPPDFTLSILDCLYGLAKARDVGLINFRDDSFNVKEYENFDDPANGDMHEVVPGRFIAFKGPREDGIPAGQLWADRGGGRVFHPSYYAEVFCALGVRAVVRLNEQRYEAAHFEREGIAVSELYFDDCTLPPLSVVFRFFRTVDEEAAGGAVAVHCKAGLGRTGTLIGLWLMRTHQFTAREAIAWLRVVRPGSVIGPQQQYLVDMQAKMWQWGSLSPEKQAHLHRNGCALTEAEFLHHAHPPYAQGKAPSAARAACGSEAEYAALAGRSRAAAATADAVAAGMDRRAAAALLRRSRPSAGSVAILS